MATDASSMQGYDWRAQRLTNEGHEFLDTIRDGEIWRRTKQVVKTAGAAGLKVVYAIAKNELKHKLIEGGVHFG